NFVQALLDVGLRQEVEEGSNSLVLFIALATEDPERSTARNGVLRRAFEVVVVRQLAKAIVHARLQDVTQTTRRFRHDRAFARQEQLLGFRGTTAVAESVILGEVGEVLEVTHERL